MKNPESKTLKAATWADNKISVRVPERADQIEIENAVNKLNKENKGGLQTTISAFMRSRAVELAREINERS